MIELTEHGMLKLVKPNPQKYEVLSEIDLRDKKLGPRALGQQRPLPGDPFWAAPILSHGLLFIRGDNQLFCLEVIPEAGSN